MSAETTDALESHRFYRTLYRRERNRDPRYPPDVYSESDNLDFQREDLAWLRSDDAPHAIEAWLESRTVTPWERIEG